MHVISIIFPSAVQMRSRARGLYVSESSVHKLFPTPVLFWSMWSPPETCTCCSVFLMVFIGLQCVFLPDLLTVHRKKNRTDAETLQLCIMMICLNNPIRYCFRALLPHWQLATKIQMRSLDIIEIVGL